MPEAEPGGGAASADDKTPASKQAVYDTAVRLFARNGFAATGMRELSREAGVNLATVNYFYGSKKGLLKVILEDYFNGVLAVATESLAGDDAPDAKMRRFVEGLARYFDSASDKLIIALSELPHDDPDITEFKAGWFRKLREIVQGGLGDAVASVPMVVVGPAMIGLAASRFLFLPVLQKVLPPEFLARAAEQYPDLVAELFINGFNGLLANNPGGRNA